MGKTLTEMSRISEKLYHCLDLIMKTLPRSDIPADFSYYRTGSEVFYEYYKKYTKLIIDRRDDTYSFIKAGRIFSSFYSVIAEKIDQEPSLEHLRSLGIWHGIIFWWPMRLMHRPKWWIRLPKCILQFFELFHSTHSAFSVLDRSDYWNKWSIKARAHRRKALELISGWRLTIRLLPDLDEYIDVYSRVHVKDPHKEYLLRWCKKKRVLWMKWIRVYLASIDDTPLAGAIFIDEGVTSEYFTSFYTQESHPFHLGVALMDRWFLDSYENWIQYCDLDHMRDSWQSFWYAWYTKFKASIADYDVYFHDMWVKIF